MDRQQALAKIEKLLAHTGDGAVNANEVAAANKLMKDLMDEHQISLDDIQEKKDEQTVEEQFVLDGRTPHPWKYYLAQAIGEFYDCRTLNRGKLMLITIGFKDDVAAARFMFSRVLKLVEQESWNYINLHRFEIGRTYTRGARAKFAFGVVIAINERLKTLKIEMDKQKNKNALIILKDKIIDEHMEENHPFVSTRKDDVNRLISNDTLHGIRAGAKIRLHDEIQK